MHVVVGLLAASLILVATLRTEATLMVFLGACVLTALYSFSEVIWQLFKDARWLMRWIARRLDWTVRLIRRDRSDGRTTPDRTGH
jgi:hypothetical protein